MSRPSTPQKINVCGKEDFVILMQKYEVSNSVGKYLGECEPPIDTARAFANAFSSQEELNKDLLGPLNIETLPDQVRISARSAIRGLWAECTTLARVALDNRRGDPEKVKKTGEDEDSLETGFRQKAMELLAAVTTVHISMDIQPSDKLLAKLNRHKKNKVLEFISLGDVRNVSDVKFLREEEEKKIGEGVKLVTEGLTKKNRFLDSTWKLYQAIKVLLFGYLLVGASDYAPENLFVVDADGNPITNTDGTHKRKKVWCSLHVVLHYLNILENAFIIDSVNGGMGKNLIANFDMGVRTRIHELSLANAAPTFDELLLMSLDAMQASTPTRALLIEENNKHREKKRRADDTSQPSSSGYKKNKDNSWDNWVPKASAKAQGKGSGDSDEKPWEPRKGKDHACEHYKRSGNKTIPYQFEVGQVDTEYVLNINAGSEIGAITSTSEVSVANKLDNEHRISNFWAEQIKKFQPSKGRDIQGIIESAAAGIQRSGCPLPRVYPEGIDAKTFFELSAQINPVATALEVAIDDDTKITIEQCNKDPAGVTKFRNEQIKILEKMAGETCERDTIIKRSIPSNSTAQRLNLGFIEYLHKKIDYEDKNLVKDIAMGMDIHGDIPETGALRCKATTPKIGVDQLKKDVVNINNKILKDLINTKTNETSLMGWQLTCEEADKGWLEPLGVISDEIIKETPITPRFCIKEQHGNQPAAFRVIDDLKKSKVNATLAQKDTYCPEAIDKFFALVREVRKTYQGEILAWTGDFHKAYKNVALSKESCKFSIIGVFNPKDGKVYAFRMKVLPFGSARSPANWGRVVRFIQAVLCKVLRIPTGCFVDDLYTCENYMSIESSFRTARKVIALMGLCLAPKKDQGPAGGILLLGAELQIKYDTVIVAISKIRATNIINLLQSILNKNRLTPGLAAKIRGKLSFATSLGFGRIGRGMLRPFAQRQYSSGCVKLDTELRLCIQWWTGFLVDIPPRIASLNESVVVPMHTDAMGFGHIGIKYRIKGRDYISHCHIPEWVLLTKYKNSKGELTYIGIAEFEIIATILGATVVASLPRSERMCVNLCIDNNIALHAIISGNARTGFRAKLAQIFWRINLCSNAIFWIEFVPSAANGGDAPSRSGLCAGEKQITSNSEILVQTPDLFRKIFESAQMFERCVNGLLPKDSAVAQQIGCVVPNHMKNSFV